MQDHYPELTCIAPGLIRTATLSEGIDQIWNDRFMPDKKAKLTQLAQCVRSLETLSKRRRRHGADLPDRGPG